MKLLKFVKENLSLRNSVLFATFPVIYIIYHFEIFLCLMLLGAILSQTRLPVSETFYYIKWALLISFLLFEYLLLNFMNLKRIHTQKYFLPKSTIILIIFLLYLTITSLFSTNVRISMFVTGTFFILIFTSLILIPYLAEHLEREQKIINMLYVFSAIVLLLNILAFEIYPLKGVDPYIPGRFRGYLENPNTLGLMGFVSFPLFLYKYKTAVTKRTKLINVLLLLTAIALAIIAYSRASLMGMIVILAVYFYYYNRRIFILGIILSTLIIVIIFTSPTLLKLLRIAGDPLSQRDKIWQLGINAWKENMLFGGGFGTTHLVTGNKYAFMVKGIFEFLLGAHFHNIYIEVLYETGLIGLIIFLLIIFFMLRETNKVIHNNGGNKKIFSICYYALLIALIIQSAFESFILSAGNVPSLIFWILTGLVINGDKIIRQHH